VDLLHQEDEPFAPPVTEYIEDALLGVRCGAGDPQTQKGKGNILSDLPAVVQRLETQLRDPRGFARDACTAAFWLSIAVVFKRGDRDVADAYRAKLSLCWHFVTLALNKESRDTREWILASLPFIFTQVAFRLLCDSFADDKKSFINDSQSVLDKIMFVINFEITGFHQNLETLRKERWRLFLPRVISQPHVNQYDVLKGIKRLDDRQSCGVSSLEFGNSDTTQVIDELQIEHVMTRRNEVAQLQLATGPPPDCSSEAACLQAERRAPVPPELNVDRYTVLEDGSDITERQLDGFDDCVEKYLQAPVILSSQNQPMARVRRFDAPDEVEAEPNATIAGVVSDSPFQARSRPNSRGENHLRRQVSSSVEFGDDEMRISYDSRPFGLAWPDGEESPGGSSQRSELFQRRMSRVVRTTPKAKSRESVSKMNRMRQELVVQLCGGDEPLPNDLRSRELNTGWVSPAFIRLTPDHEDRKDPLQKPSKDAFKVKMKKPCSLGNPVLRSLQKKPVPVIARDASEEHGDSVAVAGCNARRKTAYYQLKENCEETELVDESRDARRRAMSETSVAMQMRKVAKVSSAADPSSQGRTTTAPHNGLVALSIGPPKGLRGDQIFERLDKQAVNFRKGTFSEFTKEHDLLTGIKKFAINPGELQREEKSYLSHMRALVGGKPQRLIQMTRG
jgi:hypothetical protein